MTTQTIGKHAKTGELMNQQVAVLLLHQVRKADEVADQGQDLHLHAEEEEVIVGEIGDLLQVVIVVDIITKVVALIIGEVVGLEIETTQPQLGIETEQQVAAEKGQETTLEIDVIVIIVIIGTTETQEEMIVGVGKKTQAEEIINHIEIKVLVRVKTNNPLKLR